MAVCELHIARKILVLLVILYRIYILKKQLLFIYISTLFYLPTKIKGLKSKLI